MSYRDNSGNDEKDTICRVCGSEDRNHIYMVKEMMFGTREEFPYFMCQQCGCLQITEIPADLSVYYPDHYYSIGNNNIPRHLGLTKTRRFLERARSRTALFGKGYKLSRFAAKFVDVPPEINPVGRFIKVSKILNWGASFLDVGCGSNSWWLNDLQALGFKDLNGIDPHIERDVNKDGIHIRKANLEDIGGCFDMITLHHSLEHIPDQLKTLREIKTHLKPNGHCLIRIPLVSSLAWELYGTDWVELDAPRHLYLHSLKSISYLIKIAGFELVETTWDSGAFQFYGSEQYRRGIPLVSDVSYWRDPSCSDFTYREIAEFSELACKANQEGRGGRGCFVIRVSD